MNKMCLLLSFLIVACSQPTNNKVSYQTDKETFIKVLYDFYLSEQIVKNHTFNKDSIRIALKDQVMEIHDIKDSSVFYRELDLLMGDTDYYLEINDSVKARLTRNHKAAEEIKKSKIKT